MIKYFQISIIIASLIVNASADYRDTSVSEHNKYRVRHGVGKVTRSFELDEIAQKEAGSLAKNGFSRDSEILGDHGKNYHSTWVLTESKDEIIRRAVKSWYNEGHYYDYQLSKISSKTAPFTQLIWKESTSIGTGMVLVPVGNLHRAFVVVAYLPKGNIIGKAAYNVEKPKKNFGEIILPNEVDATIISPDIAPEDSVITSDSIPESNDNEKSLKDFREISLREHNKLRALHGIGPVSRDKTLDELAQSRADHFAEINGRDEPTHGFGENVYRRQGATDPTLLVQFALLEWYEQMKDYDFDHQLSLNGPVGRFTALIWKNTKKIGTGVAFDDNFGYVVVNYDPEGNVQGEFQENVLPALSSE